LSQAISKTAGDVTLPEGVTLVSTPDTVVVHLSVRAAMEEPVAVAAVAEGEAAPAEGEAAAAGSEGEKSEKK